LEVLILLLQHGSIFLTDFKFHSTVDVQVALISPREGKTKSRERRRVGETMSI